MWIYVQNIPYATQVRLPMDRTMAFITPCVTRNIIQGRCRFFLDGINYRTSTGRINPCTLTQQWLQGLPLNGRTLITSLGSALGLISSVKTSLAFRFTTAMYPTLFFTRFLIVGWLGVAGAKLIRIAAQHQSVSLDPSFQLDTLTCNPRYWTSVAGATVAFNFTGTAVTVIGSTDAEGGTYDVFVDSVLEDTVDRYSNTPSRRCGVRMFEKANMAYGDHTLRMIFRINDTVLPGAIDVQEIQYTIPDTTSDTPSTRTRTADADQTSIAQSSSVVPDPTAGTKTHIGAIAGGIVGGIAFLALVAAFSWFLVSRKRTRRERARFSVDLNGDGATPNPYIMASNAISSSPPAYFSISHQNEAFSGVDVNSNSSARRLPQPAGIRSAGDAAIYLQEKLASSQQSSSTSLTRSADEPHMMALASAGSRTTNRPLLENDSRRIAQAMLAQASASDTHLIPPRDK